MRRLPKYTDDENRVFHPFFKLALEKALKKKNLQTHFDILERQKLGAAGSPDFMLFNKAKNQIDLIIEIKRTKSDVESVAARRQTHGYVINSLPKISNPYYAITNLEILDLFLYTSGRQSVRHQLLHPSPMQIGNLKSDTYDDFSDNLIDACEKLINVVVIDKPKYISTLDMLFDLLKPHQSSENDWHRNFMPFAYEYLRGVSVSSKNIAKALGAFKTKPASSFKTTASTLQSVGQNIGLDKVFSNPKTESSDVNAFQHLLLNSALTHGQLRGRAEEIAELVNDIFSDKTALGIVETDPELSYLLVYLADYYLKSHGENISSSDIICDPAAGTGRLINSAIEKCFSHCAPENFWANEIIKPFIETLELRLSLSLSEKITRSNKLKITNQNIIEFSQSSFQAVKLILLNPPFISGVQSSREKNKFIERIQEETGIKSVFSKGQIGLEALFLEFIISVIKPGTFFAVILPTNFLSRLSPEMAEFRKFLIEKFGLLAIVTYPEEGLFEQAKKKTFIAIGKKGNLNSCIDWNSINYPLETIDFNYIEKHWTSEKILTSSLKSSLNNGWASPTKMKIWNWFFSVCNHKHSTFEALCNIKRGNLGNSGASKLCAISTNSDFYNRARQLPHRPAINNANTLELAMTAVNAPCISLLPDQKLAFSDQPEEIKELITEFVTQERKSRLGSSQNKKTKSTDDVLNAIIGSNTSFPANSIIIPRAIRVEARIGELLEEYNLSTNFVGATCFDQTKTLRLKAFLFSVFGQIQMELLGINQEGMRKIEVEQVRRIIVPNSIFDSSVVKDKEIADMLISTSPLNFSNFGIRELDKLFCKLIGAGTPINDSKVASIMNELIHERLSN